MGDLLFFSSRDSEGLRVIDANRENQDFENEYVFIVRTKENPTTNARFESLNYEFDDNEEGMLVLSKFYIATIEGDVLFVHQFLKKHESLEFNNLSGGWEFSHSESIAAMFKSQEYNSVRSYGKDLREQ